MLQQNTVKTQIRTSAEILGFLRQEYADGVTYTFTSLQQAMEDRNGLAPDSDWLSCKLWSMADDGQISESIGEIIPVGVLTPAEADTAAKVLYRVIGLTV